MLRKIATAVFITMLLIFAAGCGKGRTPITMAGSTAFQPFAEILAENYMNKNDRVNITVQGGGSAVGIQAAAAGAADIGMADLVALPPEAKSLTGIVVAKDGIAIVVNPQNPVNNLTTDQVRGIFSGEIKNWKDLGGRDATITVVSREAGSGTRSSFEKIIKALTGHKLILIKQALIQDSNGTIRETVANDANSVGYLSHGMINNKIKALSVDGVASTEETIMTGKYKLVRPIFLLVKGEVKGETKKFIDYILGPEGQDTIKANGLIPVK